jgi:tRNA(Ile)-lysidine synthase TilS/MesJ
MSKDFLDEFSSDLEEQSKERKKKVSSSNGVQIKQVRNVPVAHIEAIEDLGEGFSAFCRRAIRELLKKEGYQF